MKTSEERIDLWVMELHDSGPDMYSEAVGLGEENVNIAELCVGMVRAAVRLTLEHAPPKEAPQALQMLTGFMRKEMLEQLNPEPVKH